MTKSDNLPKPRYASLRKIYQPSTGDLVDKGLILWFPGPNSFTGEDLAEFQVHGGSAVVEGILTSLSEIDGLYPAMAGDFTRRAFENEKLDLTEVEGLADLIHAQTEAQRKQALRQMDGHLSQLYKIWSKTLLKSVADIEATIDFSEDVIEDGILTNVKNSVNKLAKEVRNHLEDGRRGEKLRSGVNVVIAGPPNVGKSSLLNLLCQRPAAIVSPLEGTTRDVVETAVNIGGYPVLFSDTAGIRQSIDPVEKEGIKRAKSKISAADFVLIVHDLSKYKHVDIDGLLESPLRMLNTNVDESTSADFDENIEYLMILNKADLITNNLAVQMKEAFNTKGVNACIISCETGDGIEDFINILSQKMKDICGDPVVGNPSITQARHRFHLREALNSLEIYLRMAHDGFEDHDLVLGAEELRIALRELGRITGNIGTEDILDVIFRDFCIGK
ncbi:tRNA modification GTPase GTPBP3, mitochondrial [Trichoplax sp. H2]|nr:tRNA modification GTPase GTPBP3, mitochondrial [Trichoplax sp. H2]|eukprot:RDD37303.1 tRNA modification GTPase GTPBP3, mitochondrial [Trichoplax sp. H2]